MQDSAAPTVLQEASTPYRCNELVTEAVTLCNAVGVNHWPAIQDAWCNGESAHSLSRRYGVSEAAIRTRASRQKWAKGVAKAVKQGAARAVNRVVREHVAKIAPEIKRRASIAVQECVDASIKGAKRLVTVATERIDGASDRDLSGISTSLRTGVSVWREALGLGSTDQASGGVTIACHSVHLGVEDASQGRQPEQLDRPAVDV